MFRFLDKWRYDRILHVFCINPNNDRAAWAKVALDAFMKETGTDLEDALCDLLCDLMHLSDREPFDFEAALQHARNHYLAETGQPGPLTW